MPVFEPEFLDFGSEARNFARLGGFRHVGEVVFGDLDVFVHVRLLFFMVFGAFGAFAYFGFRVLHGFRIEKASEYEFPLAFRVEIGFGVQDLLQKRFVGEYPFEDGALQAVSAAYVMTLVFDDDRALVEDFDVRAVLQDFLVGKTSAVPVLAEYLLDNPGTERGSVELRDLFVYAGTVWDFAVMPRGPESGCVEIRLDVGVEIVPDLRDKVEREYLDEIVEAFPLG